MALSLEAYAAVMAELTATSDALTELLARHGLDEARWEAIDAHWQARLSEALAEESDGIPPLIAAYSAAYEAARRALPGAISLEQFAAVTRLLGTTSDIQAALAKIGVSFAAYVQGSEHWTRQIAEDPEIERRFHAALRG